MNDRLKVTIAGLLALVVSLACRSRAVRAELGATYAHAQFSGSMGRCRGKSMGKSPGSSTSS